MAENVNPKAGPGSGLVIVIIGVVVLLALVLFYWMGAWRASDTVDGPGPEQPVQQQPVAPPPS